MISLSCPFLFQLVVLGCGTSSTVMGGGTVPRGRMSLVALVSMNGVLFACKDLGGKEVKGEKKGED